jgi:hypothetical protein
MLNFRFVFEISVIPLVIALAVTLVRSRANTK